MVDPLRGYSVRPGHFVQGGGGGVGVVSISWSSSNVCARGCCVAMFDLCVVSKVVIAVYDPFSPF